MPEVNMEQYVAPAVESAYTTEEVDREVVYAGRVITREN